MGIAWKFYLDGTLVDEPVGWDEIVLNIQRDERWQGIFFEASASTLGFYGEGAALIDTAKESYGFAAEMTLRIEAVCGETIDILEGRLDFGTYDKSCGDECITSISVERAGCVMKLKNRYDQKVDLDKSTAFDNLTLLQNYPGLNFTMELPAQELDARVEGFVSDEGDSGTAFITLTGAEEGVIIRPIYGRVLFNSINRGQLDDATGLYQDMSEFSSPISPQLLFDDTIECFNGDFNYEVRLKGNVNGSASLTSLLGATLVVGYWEATNNPNDIFTDITILDSLIVSGSEASPFSVDFDETFTGTVEIPAGAGVYAFVRLDLDSLISNMDINYSFDPETYFQVFATKSCPATDASVSLINETGSRIVEAITDGCMQMKSDYFGRTDSLPYSSSSDGCGSLRTLTSGLRIRNAETPKHFISLQEFFNGLRGIDNIGIGVEANTVIGMGNEWLRIEPVEYFYQDEEILRCDHAPRVKSLMDSNFAYSLIKIGYAKWEVEDFNGLDEFNSNKEFRTSLSTVDKPLDAVSTFIAGGYPIEVTRQQNFADSGGADTKYDNDNFIICVDRNAYGYQVEQGNVNDAANFYSPFTAYNWRIRPFYNLMRWWKSIAQVYKNLTNTTSKLFFSSGAGNLTAEGQITLYDECKLENKVKAENDDLGYDDFAVPNNPIYQPERITFTYPMSLRDYNSIKSNPYGYISVQCGNGIFIKGYILDIKYRPAQGIADFNLIKTWQ